MSNKRRHYRTNIAGAGLVDIRVVAGGDRYVTINCETWDLQPADIVLALRDGAHGITILGWYPGNKVRQLEKDKFGKTWSMAYKLRLEDLNDSNSFLEEISQ